MPQRHSLLEAMECHDPQDQEHCHNY
jgi:hypothetical protein